jgi:hypothetical protein
MKVISFKPVATLPLTGEGARGSQQMGGWVAVARRYTDWAIHTIIASITLRAQGHNAMMVWIWYAEHTVLAHTWILRNPRSTRAIVWRNVNNYLQNNNNSVALVRERTIPTERSPLVGEITATFCG